MPIPLIFVAAIAAMAAPNAARDATARVDPNGHERVGANWLCLSGQVPPLVRKARQARQAADARKARHPMVMESWPPGGF